MEFEPIIGLEIHVQLKTKSKMFCSCPNIFGDVEPNSAICPICMGYPGTLPVPNKKAIEWTQLAGAALDCDLSHQSKFDRKSYFYPDLPKGYQISQYDQPFCRHGKLAFSVEGENITCGITRIHLEEDAAKNTHPAGADYTLIDYNRAGTPLIEIVTEPDLRSPAHARAFLQELRRILRVLDVSDADMEKGQLRCDANISLRPKGEEKLNPKTEIKNLNSFRNIERALTFEIERQIQMHDAGSIPKQETTRGFNADTGKTTEQRSKEGAADYRYFPDPDLPPFAFTKDELDERRRAVPELPLAKEARFQRQYRISSSQARLFADISTLADFYEHVISELEQLDKERVEVIGKDIVPLASLAANMSLRHLRPFLEQGELNISPENFAELVVLVYQDRIGASAVAPVLAEMQKTSGDPDAIIQNLGLEQVSDVGELSRAADEVIEENPDVAAKIKAGKESAIQFLVGKVMQKTGGKANPQHIIKILQRKILSE
ncbi:MAG: Asp-tRNA(Asn)/Glu-tRNA(Gln) amidotransferase subunit GatB [Candidatus Andersenbacteria bacterium CG10_big_fil_rev_8_21_14_0_10_54_11]|uniref:Aspartyl/glutamyl-tRNA(Asn/Gln) amidotransferase subunit B n=1 Tax=Candidatus Andersenbacteria bacterium CG10_big_fil_rev_8_21_14_0_10_54_11 TaxID=1974485 RepID=A0A2M6WZ08_9BACT|nr:MAG: Asp-tRNA(Asn)/Glu-tRNA(Gln) amidotransferase subunit GatB [Candidatus Andersenbacteria bacterium CG10_big_fil_rev_8_21_14_0_10_54_11]